jgi:RimJ/RimL family protein N-acetyltransferase
MFPEAIETRRLVLRRPRPEDAEGIFRKYAQDTAVTRYLLWAPHGSVHNTREFIARCAELWTAAAVFSYVIARKADTEMLGMLESRIAGHRAELGFVLARPYWGNGYMPEAVSAMIALALAQPPIFRVEATCDTENVRSARVMEKAGLVFEGKLRRHMIHPNISSEPRDSLMFAAVK